MAGTVIGARFIQSFRHHRFRVLWASDAFVALGEQMELVVLGWYVLSETDSPLLVALYGALRFAGTLFAPFFGVAADRFDRRSLLLAVRVIFLAVAGAVLLLAVSDRLEVWYVLCLAGVAGIGRGFDNVIRQAVLADVVPSGQLMNAVAVTRIARDLTQLLGPLAAGFLLTGVGIAKTYWVIVGSYAVAAGTGFALGAIPVSKVAKRASVVRDLMMAVVYVRRHEVVLGLLLLAFLVNLTAFPLNNGLMPVFAKSVLGLGPSGLGGLLSAYAAGGLLGSVVVSVLPPMARPGRAVLLASVAWHSSLLAFSWSGWLAPSFGLLVAAGVAQSFTMVVMGMLLLRETGHRFRGRVMGLRSLAIYGLPVGLLVTGAMAERLGAPLALALAGLAGIVLTALIGAGLRGLWRTAGG